MFATMYSTQAILPEISSSFAVSPPRAGLTISSVMLAVAVGAWLWGPLSDRYGRRRSLLVASVLLVPPTLAAAVAPTFPALLAARAAQGLCMPGLLAVGVPYVMEAFAPRLGGLAMGYYVSSLVAGGLVGRVGVALLASWIGWRSAIGALAVLPLAAALVMYHTLPDVPVAAREEQRLKGVGRHLRNVALLRTALSGSALFFSFVGVFSYITFRLEAPPFSLGTGARGLIFFLWLFGVAGPVAGRLADRVGWQRLLLGALLVAAAGLLLSLPEGMATLVPGLALLTIAMFTGATAAQVGVFAAARTDRGAASALYFSSYYLSGLLGAYLPGIAWEAWGWNGVVFVGCAVVLGAAMLAAPAAFRR